MFTVLTNIYCISMIAFMAYFLLMSHLENWSKEQTIDKAASITTALLLMGMGLFFFMSCLFISYIVGQVIHKLLG